MWYAASEIIFFLVLAAVIGGTIGFGIAQIYELDVVALREAWGARGGSSGDLTEATEEIAELRRRLTIATDALRGDDAAEIEIPVPSIELDEIPTPAATTPPDTGGDTTADVDNGFPPIPSAGHPAPAPAEPETPSGGRRLSDRVADASKT